jgi:hypothetical protein
MWISVAAHDQLPVSKKDAACLASFSVENISPTMPTTRLWLLVGLSVPSFRLRVLARRARGSKCGHFQEPSWQQPPRPSRILNRNDAKVTDPSADDSN